MSDFGWALWGVTIGIPFMVAIGVVVLVRSRQRRRARVELPRAKVHR